MAFVLNDYPACCGAEIITSFGYADEANIKQLENIIEGRRKAYPDGRMIECVLADYQVGDVQPESDNYEGEDGGAWKDKTWLPTLKRLGFRFAGRFTNGGHVSQCFVFQLNTNDSDEASEPPKGW